MAIKLEDGCMNVRDRGKEALMCICSTDRCNKAVITNANFRIIVILAVAYYMHAILHAIL